MIGIYISITALTIGYAINSWSIYKLKGKNMNRYRVQIGNVVVFLEALSTKSLIKKLRKGGITAGALIRKAGDKEWK